MVIVDLWGMFYHPVVVRARTFVLLLDLISAYCEHVQFVRFLHFFNGQIRVELNINGMETLQTVILRHFRNLVSTYLHTYFGTL